jgi:hypothetical protein
MPTMSKNLEDLPEISTMWQAARLALRSADSLLLFGFSFPNSDELLVQLIRLTCNDGRSLRRVGVIDLEPESVLDRFQSCLPSGCDIEAAVFPVIKGEMPMWLEVATSGPVLKPAR